MKQTIITLCFCVAVAVFDSATARTNKDPASMTSSGLREVSDYKDSRFLVRVLPFISSGVASSGCDGVFIDTNIVLTVIHGCLDMEPAHIHLYKLNTTTRAINWAKHPNYKVAQDINTDLYFNNIVFIFLNKRNALSSKIIPIKPCWDADKSNFKVVATSSDIEVRGRPQKKYKSEVWAKATEARFTDCRILTTGENQEEFLCGSVEKFEMGQKHIGTPLVADLETKRQCLYGIMMGTTSYDVAIFTKVARENKLYVDIMDEIEHNNKPRM